MKRRILFFTLAAIASLGIAAQGATLTRGGNMPSVDGSMTKGEYQWMSTVGDFSLGLSLSEDGSTLFCGITVKATGWVSVGLGSEKMDGSYMVMGYDNRGAQNFSEHLGRGHRHSEVAGIKRAAQSVKTVEDMTCLEFSIHAEEFIKDGKLPLILGASNGKNFRAFHRTLARLSVNVAP